MARFQVSTPEQKALIERSKLFFIASVATDLSDGPDQQGPVNLSPTGGVPLHVIDEKTVAYLDYHGSGDETARHAATGGPITVMVASMESGDAAIVRLYGKAEATPVEDSPLSERLLADGAGRKGLRQVIRVLVDSTQTSCGYSVPVFEYVEDRSKSQRGRQYKEPRSSAT